MDELEQFDPKYFNGGVVHSGARLKRQLPQSLDDDLRGEVGGRSAAEQGSNTGPKGGCSHNTARALRFARYPDEGYAIFLKTRLPTLKGTARLQNICGYFYEWGTCAGNLSTRQGYIINAWLALYSLSTACRPK